MAGWKQCAPSLIVATCRDDIDFFVQFLTGISDVQITRAVKVNPPGIAQPISENLRRGVRVIHERIVRGMS